MKKKQYKSVAIYLRGARLNPELISKMLGVQPSRSQRKGEFKQGSTRFFSKIGVWTLKVESDSRSISRLVDELFKKLANAPTRLDKINNVKDAYLDIFVPVSKRGFVKGSLELGLSKTQIRKLMQLGLSVLITVT